MGKQIKQGRTQDSLIKLLTSIKKIINDDYGDDPKYVKFVQDPFETNIDRVIKALRDIPSFNKAGKARKQESMDDDAKKIYKAYYDTLDQQLGYGKRISKKEIFKVLANKPTIQKSSNKNIEAEILNILNS